MKYIEEQIKRLKELLAKGISDSNDIRQVASHSIEDLQNLNLVGSPSNMWFVLLNHAKNLVGEDYIQKLVENAFDTSPKNRYLLEAKELVSGGFEFEINFNKVLSSSSEVRNSRIGLLSAYGIILVLVFLLFPYLTGSKDNFEHPTGTILSYAGAKDKIPNGWLLCNGEKLEKDTYSKLFKVIGEHYGKVEGGLKFKLPDLRGVFLRGVGFNSNPLGKLQEESIQAHDHQIDLEIELDGEHSHDFKHDPNNNVKENGGPHLIKNGCTQQGQNPL